MAIPRLANPGQMEKTRDPNANIVVALVRRIALPVKPCLHLRSTGDLLCSR